MGAAGDMLMAALYELLDDKNQRFLACRCARSVFRAVEIYRRTRRPVNMPDHHRHAYAAMTRLWRTAETPA